jgi:hypothetical protein
VTKSPTKRAVIFVLSESRSGSTWFSYVLGSLPGVAHLGEYLRPFTRPGHVACRLCEARGKSECEILHGIENVPASQAYDFAFERFGRPILSDASKTLEWTERFLGQDRFEVKTVHLLRDPRGWYASETRRGPIPIEAAVERWVETNRQIADFVASHKIPCFRAIYDDLTARPDGSFPPLCQFVGTRYESGALEYWNYEHHGLGGNGAAFNVLGKYEGARVTTGDDAFYKANAQKRFSDTRWRTQLSEAERQAFEQSAAVQAVLHSHGCDLRHFDELVAVPEEKGPHGPWWRSASRLLAR